MCGSFGRGFGGFGGGASTYGSVGAAGVTAAAGTRRWVNSHAFEPRAVSTNVQSPSSRITTSASSGSTRTTTSLSASGATCSVVVLATCVVGRCGGGGGCGGGASVALPLPAPGSTGCARAIAAHIITLANI